MFSASIPYSVYFSPNWYLKKNLNTTIKVGAQNVLFAPAKCGRNHWNLSCKIKFDGMTKYFFILIRFVQSLYMDLAYGSYAT